MRCTLRDMYLLTNMDGQPQLGAQNQQASVRQELKPRGPDLRTPLSCEGGKIPRPQQGDAIDQANAEKPMHSIHGDAAKAYRTCAEPLY